MKGKLLFLLLIAGLLFVVGCDKDDDDTTPVGPGRSGNLYINEFLASNDASGTDENDEYDDWFELWNDSDNAIDIGGYYVTDNLEDPMTWQIPTDQPSVTTIPAGGFLVIWCDKQTDQGPLHVDIKLSADGEAIGVYEEDGSTVVDEVTFGPQSTDISYGRIPDGGDAWDFLSPPTPGDYNSGVAPNQPPTFDTVNADPSTPLPDEAVTISAVVYDDAEGVTVVLSYRTTSDGDFTQMTMEAVEGEDYTYAATIAGQADGTTVEYYVTATDAEELATTDPADAPTEVHSYVVEVSNYTLPLFINELMSSNVNTLSFDYEGETYYEDWIEIYNAGDEPIDIGGMWVSDDLNSPRTSQIPTTSPTETTIPAGGYLILWADKMPEAGVLHIDDVKLSSGGESFGLFAADEYGNVQIDGIDFPELTDDQAYGRTTDGGSTLEILATPTPGSSNGQ